MTTRLEPIEPGHIEPLCHFLAGFPDERRPLEFWRRRLQWWWRDNPHAGRGPLGFALWHEGLPVGLLATIPTLSLVGGRTVAVSNASTWRVDPVHRRDSLKTLLAMMGKSGEGALVCATPNDISLAVLTGLKFRLLPLPVAATTLRLTYGLPLRLRLGDGPFSRAAGAALDAAQKLRLGALRPVPGFQVEESAAGPDFDELWERTKTQMASTNLRDSATLAWICQGNPDRRKIILACRKGPRLTGFLILEPSRGGGEKGLYGLDAWWDMGEPRAVQALLTGALLWAWRQGHDFLQVRHYHPALAEVLRSLPGARPKHLPHRHFFWAKREAAERLLGTGGYFVDLEGDTGL